MDENDENYLIPIVDSTNSKIYTEVEIAKEIADQTSQLQTLENSIINSNVRPLNYTVKLEPVTILTKSTGYREASNQSVNGINGYKEHYGYVIGTPIVTRLDFDVR